jgi:hypothetical protein
LRGSLRNDCRGLRSDFWFRVTGKDEQDAQGGGVGWITALTRC